MYVLSERWLIHREWWLIHAEWWLFPTSADQCGQNTGHGVYISVHLLLLIYKVSNNILIKNTHKAA